MLLPTDLSATSDRVAECAGSLVPLGTKSVILLHALGLRHLKDMAPALEEAVRPGLEAQAHALEAAGVAVEVLIVPGVAHREINRVARERRVSLVLLGTQGMGLANELRIGSVSLETLHRCEVPLLMARASPSSAPGAPTRARAFPRRIFHPTDFSDCAERAFSYVRALVAGGVEAVSLLHVQERAGTDARLRQRVDESDRIDRVRLDRLSRDLETAGAPYVHAEIAHGSPVDEILLRVSDPVDHLVVLGTQGRGLIPEVFLGSVSHAVARHATGPVLLVPAGPAREIRP